MSSDDSGKLARWRLRLLSFDFEVVHRDGIDHQVPEALSSLKTEPTDKNNLDETLPEPMINDTEEKGDVKTEDSDGDQPDNKRTSNHMGTNAQETKPRRLRKPLVEQANDRAYTQAALAVGFSKSLLPFDSA